MTIKEKRQALCALCKSHIMCDDCVLKDEATERCLFTGQFGNMPLTKLEEAYSRAFGKDGVVNHPSHYQGKHECIEVMRAMFGDEAVAAFCRCNSFKYRFRAGNKDGNTYEQDIAKAVWYENYLIEMLKGGETDSGN